MSDTAAVAPANACPKCNAALEAKAIACPQCGAQVAQAKPDKIELTTGQKIAAAVLILNGLTVLAETFLIKDSETARQLKSALVSIVLGGYLFTGKASALKWAKIAVILGGVIFTVVSIVQGEIFGAVIQLLFSLSLAGLLFGRAGKIRLALCCLAVLGYFALEGVGLYMTAAQPPAPPAQSVPKT